MIIARKWLEEFVDLTEISDEELATRIGSRLVEVEEVIKYNGKYDGIFVVEVKSVEPVEGSDHLNLTLIDDAGVMERYNPDCVIARNSKGLIPVVCGAPNVRAGMLAVWIAPGATVPATFDEPEPFVIAAKKIRGVMSYGMLAGADELGFGDQHDSILEIEPAMGEAGLAFAPLMRLDSTLFDIENKSLTHRPDCFGVIGFAREVAGILDEKFTTPDYLREQGIAQQIERLRKLDAGEWAKIDKRAVASANGALSLDVEITEPELCSRYAAVILEENLGQATTTPCQYLQTIAVPLLMSGVRLVNPLVDYSNYLMLLTGQPLHFFDYDKLLALGGGKTAKITVRAARKREKLELLNHKSIELAERDIVITSNDVPIALAGVMGGLNTEIDQTTKRIVVESASFNLYRIRETSFRYGLFSEAVTRFTKGQPAALAEQVILLTVTKLRKDLGFGLRSSLAEAGKNAALPKLTLDLAAINNLLGSNYQEGETEEALANVEFEAGWADHQLVVRPPYWRTDIKIAEDVIEEIGRLLGFDNLPQQLPKRECRAPYVDQCGDFASQIRQTLASFGGNEILTYSFVSRELLAKCGLPTDTAYEVINSISPELQIIRPRLLPSLLGKLEVNLRELDRNFTLFEINQVYDKAWGLDAEGTPAERQQLALLQTGSDFYQLKHWLVCLLDALGLRGYTFAPLNDTLYANGATILHGTTELAHFGQIAPGLALKFGADTSQATQIFAAEFSDLQVLLGLLATPHQTTPRQPSSKFPAAKRDLSLAAPNGTPFQALAALITQTLTQLDQPDLIWTLAPLDIFTRDDRTTTTFRLTLAHLDHTLLAAEIASIMQALEQAAASTGYRIV